MKKEYLTISEASKKYKKSSSTITRFARQNEKSNFVKKEKGKYLVSDAFLAANFKKVENHAPVEIQTSNQNEKKEIDKFGSEFINSLKSENEFLRSQSIEKDKQINTLLQRQFEQNSIIQTLQNRIESIGTKIDNSVLLISDKVKENKPVASNNIDNSNYGYTLASSVMIILLVIMIIIFLIV
jgi:hypothetical protein